MLHGHGSRLSATLLELLSSCTRDTCEPANSGLHSFVHPQKSAAEIEAEQEAKLAQKYGGLAKKKLMPKVSQPTSAL